MKTKKTTKRAASIKTMMTNLAKVEADLGPDVPAITSSEKRRVAKPRKGGERIVAMIGALAAQHNLDSLGLSSSEMVAQQEIANSLVPVAGLLTRLLKRVEDQRFVATSSAWQTSLQFYSLLQRLAVNDGELATNLAPIANFFAYRHGDVLDGKPTKLQTRAKAKLAHAEKLAASARSRIGAGTHVDSPVASTPVASQTVQPAPVAAAAPPATTQMFVAPKSNGAATGAVNGAANGALNGAVNGAANGGG